MIRNDNTLCANWCQAQLPRTRMVVSPGLGSPPHSAAGTAVPPSADGGRPVHSRLLTQLASAACLGAPLRSSGRLLTQGSTVSQGALSRAAVIACARMRHPHVTPHVRPPSSAGSQATFCV